MTKTVDQVQIGDAVFDPDSGELSVHGDRSNLRPQTARVLARIIHQTSVISFGHTGSAGLTAAF
jgi:hypothetical protein